jgi:hypothetical protein
MRVNTTVVIELPAEWDEVVEQIARATTFLAGRKIWQAEARESSQRDGTPATISLTIAGEVTEPETF